MDFADRIYYQAINGSPINNGVPATLASLIVAQAKHETGDFTSNFFRQYNNAFGYSYSPVSRYQVASGSTADNSLPIAVYNSIEDSTKELVDWIYRRQSEGKFPDNLAMITTPEQYATLLKQSGYYTDTVANYAAGLKRWFIRVLQVARESGSSFYILIAAGAIAWYLYRKK